MLYLVTGTPGSGKTLNTIKFVAEAKQFEGRDIYYFGIRDLSPDLGWQELTEEEAFKWYELPSNAVIIFDEAYNVFPTKHGSQGTPEHVKRLATHRHQGHDVFLICQKVVGQLDTFVRGLINRHQHYARIMGSLNINRFTWDVCQQNPDSASTRKDANVDQFRMDKKYFGVYHSADSHTHTLSVPWKKIVFIFVLLGMLGGLVYTIKGFFIRDDPVPVTSSYSGVVGGQVMGGGSRQMSFSDLVTPEVDGFPWSAPMYREAFSDVQDWPKPSACYTSERTGCRCFTQQGTPLDVPDEMCLAIVSGGFFDHTRPVAGRDSSLGGEGGGRGLPPPANIITQAPPPDVSYDLTRVRVEVVPQSGRF